METVKTKKSKFLVVLIVFMILFSNFGYTIAAIATSDEFQVINNGFFKKDEVKFKAYFEDESGNKIDEITGNVNQKVKLILEVLPQVEGYLKNATIKVVSDDENVNFKISNLSENVVENLESSQESLLENVGDIEVPEEEVKQEETQDEPKEESANNIVGNNEVKAEEKDTNTTIADLLNSIATNKDTEDSKNANTVADNTSSETNTVENEVKNEESNDANEKTEEPVADSDAPEDEELINEEEVIEEKTEEAKKLEEEIANAALDVSLISDTEIGLINIIEDTKIVADLEYIQGETLNVADLCKNIKLQLSGTYINSDLEEVKIGKQEEITLGWKYSKDIELESEYTKFSPFEIGGIKGTIVENKISVKREITDEKYLPLKTTNLEVTVPKVNGKSPIEVDVMANKLMATRGEDTGYTSFTQENWNYDKELGKIVITVNNDNTVNTSGIDEYVIIYRYEDYISEENSNLDKVVKVKVEEYSSKENNILTKEINNKQEIKVDVGELITYNISSTEEKINKAKVYANYNSENSIYETEYTTQVNVNILTSDILENLKIDSTKEVYKDANGVEFEAQGIEYKKIKFNYADVTSILSEGGEIVITNTAGDVLYTLNSSLITKEEDCTINLNGVNGIYIYAKNIAKNGNINFELTKAIKKCNYEKSTFQNIREVESRITAEVKYQAIEETLALQTISTKKQFEESSTSATLSINKETLSTIQDNKNVELKIELNNDKENSDLYVNPTFELVFPKYVNAVSVESINLLYENGLKVSDFKTYTESGIVKMRIELEGKQTTFSDSSMTNGTNIIVNVNIAVDDYTPSKEDQIKLYYYNEGVSNYQSQTKWTINKKIPNGILKTTNGFDVALIKYQAPKGLVAINGIVNYDGNLSEVRSVKQGKVTKQIAINSPSRIATMELLALNNTENECSDLVLIGRVPFKGNKDVISNEDIGTTTDVIVRDLIKADVQNTNMTTIYYSTNPEANKNLEDPNNGWTKDAIDPATVKSYLIVVNGKLAAGQVLRFTYDFEISANLPYEASIAGSFGAYYNNNTDVAVVYESSSADIVGLVTEAGPKMEASLSVDVGDGNTIGSARKMDYKVKVKNSGSVVANDLKVEVDIPEYTALYTKDETSPYGNYGYFVHGDVKKFVKEIDVIGPGEEKEIIFSVFTSKKPTLEEYADGKDEGGYYKNVLVSVENTEMEQNVENTDGTEEDNSNPKEVFEKQYITEVPPINIECKANITSSMFTNPIETNKVSNELTYSDFSSEIRLDFEGDLLYGDNKNFTCVLQNISGRDLKDVMVAFNVGKLFTLNYAKINGEDIEGTLNKEEGRIYFNVGDIEKGKINEILVNVDTTLIENTKEENNCKFEFFSGNNIEESLSIYQVLYRDMMSMEDISYNLPKTINENEGITISAKVTNIGEAIANAVSFIGKVDREKVSVESVRYNGNSNLPTGDDSSEEFGGKLPSLLPGDSATIDISLKAKNLPGKEDSVITLYRKVTNENQEDIELEPISIKIINNLKTDKEIEEDRLNDYENNQDNNQEDKPSIPDENPDVSNTPDDNTDDNNDNNLSNDRDNNSSNEDNITNKSDSNNENISNGEDNTNNTVKNETYSISGKAWLDKNKDGIRDDSDEALKGKVNAYLLDARTQTMLQSATTSNNGIYKFENVSKGRYVVAFVYDMKVYGVTTYKVANVGEDRNSDAIESNVDFASAITNEIQLDKDIDNIDLGLIIRDTLDLSIKKYISSVIVSTTKGDKEYKFNDEELAKVEIRAKELEGAKVKFNYKIVVENIGDIDANYENIIDYMPKDMEFNQEENENWYISSDGILALKNSSNEIIKVGEKKEYYLTLTKQMNEDNTGTVANKVMLQNVYTNDNTTTDKQDNNTSIQNILVFVSTGRTIQLTIIIIALLGISYIIYLNRNKFKFIKNNSSDNIKKKKNMKKIYR